MKISIKATDFCLYPKLRARLDGMGLTLLNGDNRDSAAATSNGAGKSTIGMAFTWAIFGDVPGLEGEIIRHGTKETVVEVGLDDWKITRSKRGRRTSLVLSHGDEDKSGSTQDETQAKINEIIGMDYNVWRNTQLYSQEDRGRFLDATDSDRKKLLRSVFGFEAIAEGQKRARDKLKELDVKDSALEGDLTRLEYEEKTSKRLIEEYTSQIRRFKAEKPEVDADLQPEIDKLAGQIGDLTSQKPQDGSESDEIEIRLNTIRGDQKELERQISRCETAALRAKDEIARFKNGKCPTCGTPASGKHVSGIVKQAKKDLETAETGKEAAEEQLRNFDAEEIGLRKRLDTELKKEAAIDTEIERLKGKRGQLKFKLDQQRKQVERYREDLAQAKRKRGEESGKIEEIRKKAEKLVEERGKLHAQVERYRFWADALGLRGVQNMIFDDLVQQFEQWTNRYLDILCDGTIRVEYDTKSTLASGQERDKFKILLTIEGKEGVRASGGQKVKLSICIGLALAEMVRGRSKLDILILDELFKELDGAGRVRMGQLLEDLNGKYGSVFVITHEPNIEEQFERVWTAVKEKGKSRIVA